MNYVIDNFRTEEQRDNQKLVAMDLLNRRAEEFQASDVLLRLPPEWSLAAIAPALIKMAKGSIHKVYIYVHFLIRKFSST